MDALIHYKATGKRELRDQAVEEYMALVWKTARRVRRRLPKHIDLDDLVSAGSIGLLEAIEKFDPARGIRFTTFASYRIRGRILDELRALDWVPRTARERFRRAMAAATDIEKETGEPAPAQEVAARVGLSVEQLADLMIRVMRARFLSLNEPVATDDNGKSITRAEQAADDRVEDPGDVVLRTDFFATIFEQLGFREGFIVFLYYLEGLTMKEIGHRLGLSESRICQLHGRSIRALRSILQKRAA